MLNVGRCSVARLHIKFGHLDGMHCIIYGTSILVKIKSVALYNCRTVYLTTHPHPLLIPYSLASPFYFFFPFHIINGPILTYSGNYTTCSFHFTQAVIRFLHLFTLNISVKVGYVSSYRKNMIFTFILTYIKSTYDFI
jgi:hypothetical protein